MRYVEVIESATVTGDPAFQRWFAGSKVVDADGAPLRVFHGTSREFAQFDLSFASRSTAHPTARLGLFFTTSPEAASAFARHNVVGSERVIPVYLAIRKPWTISALNFGAAFVRGIPDRDLARKKIARMRAVLHEKGFDGIHIIGFGSGDPAYEFHGDNWVVFQADQIRSAITVEGSRSSSGTSPTTTP